MRVVMEHLDKVTLAVLVVVDFFNILVVVAVVLVPLVQTHQVLMVVAVVLVQHLL
jgi:hypothetical protein